MAGLQLKLDTEREEKRLLQEQLQEAEVGRIPMRRESKSFFFKNFIGSVYTHVHVQR